jgi:photosystem II stability/assembly factor-like uncharacterized protein
MSKRIFTFFAVVFLFTIAQSLKARQQTSTASSPAAANPAIQQLISQVSQDSILSFVRKLESYGTRYEYTPQRDSAATYILNTMKRLGYSTESDIFSFSIADFFDIDMLDQNNGWVIGQDTRNQQNFLMRTTTGGRSWSMLTPPTATSLNAVDFIDSLKGWIVGSGGGIFRTTNAGLTWDQQISGTSSQLTSVRFLDDKTGVIVGYGGVILRTADAGLTWNPVSWGGTTSLRKCQLVGTQDLWAVGNSGVILVSRDGGKTWVKQNSRVSEDLTSIDFGDSLRGWAVGSRATVLRTINGGTIWDPYVLPQTARMSPDSKLEDVATWGATSVVMTAGEAWRTSDFGVTWTRVLALGTHSIRRTGGQTALTMGGPFGIYRSSDAGATWQVWDQYVPRSLYSTSKNCSASLAGVVSPDKEYLFIAHYDSPLGNDPGADNNGSGIAVLLEMMRVLKASSFESTIRFVAISGKEVGLLGSNRFISRNIGRNIRFVMNLDMIGYPVVGDTTRAILGSYLRRSSFVDSARAYTLRYAIGQKIDAPVDTIRDGDVYPFDVAGYEAIQVSEGTQKEIVAGNPYLLKPTDTSDKLNRGMMQRTAQLMLSMAAELAKPVLTLQKSWTWRIPFDRWNNLRAVHTIDPNVAFASGDLGTILKTTNGGRNWTQQTSGAVANLRGICFVDANRGFAVGDQGVVLRTTNGGANWIYQKLVGTSSVTFYGVSFSSATSGTIVGDYGSIFQTYDGGATWTQRIITPLMTINAISYLDQNNGAFVGSLGTIYGTKDGGLHWNRLYSALESPTAQQLLAVSFSDVSHGTAVGEFGTILRTTNGGTSWFPQQSGTRFHLRAVRFIDNNNGFATGDQGLIIGTTDGGETWTEREFGLTSWFAGLRFSSATTGLMVGSDGMMMRTTDAGKTWTYQIGGPRIPLYGVRFVGTTKGIAVGYQGSIYGTIDGGLTWQAAVSNSTNELRGIDYVDQNNLVVVGDKGAILRSTDGGTSWKDQTIPVKADSSYWFSGVALTPGGDGLAVGRLDSLLVSYPQYIYTSRSAVMRTTDGGRTWVRNVVRWNRQLNAVSFGGLNVVTAVGEGGLIIRSTDRGATWIQQTSGSSAPLNAVSFAGTDVGFAVGNGGVVLQTADGGATWTKQQSATTMDLKGVWTMNGINVVAVGGGGTVIVSNNSGTTWTGVATDATVDLFAVHFSDIDRGTIVGDKGMVLRTVASGTISAVELPEIASVPTEFSLAQNYPNPFNGSTTIEFALSKTSPVVVKVFDLLGRDVATLVDDMKVQGTYRIRWDSKSLPSGVYFYRLTVGEFIITKKMMLLK